MHIFCTECGKHIDVSLEELENQSGHLVCPQCLAEIDVDVDLFNGNETDVPIIEDDTVMPANQQGPTGTPTPPPPPTQQVQPTPPQLPQQPPQIPQPAQPPQVPSHIDDVMRYCKHCGAFLKEGVNFCPKCGKYVRVSAPVNLKPPMTPAQQEAAKLRVKTPPVQRMPQNNQSSYRTPQGPRYQATPVKQRNPINSTRNGAKRRTNSSSNSGSKFSILSLGGCLTFTIIAVALFFIIYIIIGANYD